MSWTVAQAKERKPELTDALAVIWVESANTSLTACLANQGTQADCEAAALVQADSAVKDALNSKQAEKMQVVNFVTAPQTLVKYATFENRKHLVAPVVALVAGVVNGKLASAEEIAKFVDSWNGIPIPVSHPSARGVNITANSPAIIEQQCIGRFFNAKFENNALKGEMWIDVEKAKAMGGDALVVLTRLQKGEPVEVSTGYFAEVQSASGVVGNKEYDGAQVNIRPDHLAVLPNEVGACSWDDGCGVPRVNASQKEKRGIVRRLLDGVTKRFWSNMEQSFDEISSEIRNSLSVLENITGNQYLWIMDVYSDRVIYSKQQDGADDVTYERTYRMDANGNPEFGAAIEVERMVSYTPVRKADATQSNQRGDAAGGTMDKKAVATKLITNGAFPEEKRTVLEALDESVLTVLQTHCVSPAANDKQPDPKVVVTVETPPQVTGLDADTLAFISNAKTQAQVERKRMEEAVIANLKMTQEEVTTLSFSMLQKLYERAHPTVNYQGLGLFRSDLLTANATDGNDIGLPPPSMEPQPAPAKAA